MNQTFIKIMQTFLLLVLVVLILFISTITIVLRPILRDQNRLVAERTFQSLETDMTLLQQTAKDISSQLMLNAACSPLLNATNDQSLDALTVTNGINQLRLLQTTNDYLHSIYIVNKRVDLVFSSIQHKTTISSGAFPDQDIFTWIDDIDHVYKLIKRQDISNQTRNIRSDVYTYVLPNRYSGNTLESAVVINFSLTNLAKHVSAYEMLKNSTYLYIADSDDMLIEFNTIALPQTDKLRTWALDTIQGRVNNENMRLDGETYSLIYYYSPSTHMHFVLAQPQRVIFSTLNQIQSSTIKIMIFSILLGALLSLLASSYVHGLFSKIDHERQHLSLILQGNTSNMRKDFWRNYLTCSVSYTDAQISEHLRDLKIIDAERGSLCILALDLPRDLPNDFSNCVHDFLDMCKQLRPLFLFQDANLLTFLLHPDQEADWALVPDLLTALAEKLPCSFNLIGNKITSQFSQYPLLWSSLAIHAALSFFYPSGTFLDCEKISSEHQESSNRSNLRIVNCISNSILQADLESALRFFHQFEQSLLPNTYGSYLNHMVWLAMSVTDSVKASHIELAKSSDATQPFEVFVLALHRCTRRQQLLALFQQYLSDMAAHVHLIHESRTSTTRIDGIRQYVKQNYQSNALTPNSIAEAFALSPDYLRKIFKSISGVSLVDYIAQTRLEAAGNYLIQTEDSLKVVSEVCGFSSVNYFCTCFKKYYGMTPTNYRTIHKQQNADV